MNRGRRPSVSKRSPANDHAYRESVPHSVCGGIRVSPQPALIADTAQAGISEHRKCWAGIEPPLALGRSSVSGEHWPRPEPFGREARTLTSARRRRVRDENGDRPPPHVPGALVTPQPGVSLPCRPNRACPRMAMSDRRAALGPAAAERAGSSRWRPVHGVRWVDRAGAVAARRGA
jgi:hypothetical protein